MIAALEALAADEAKLAAFQGALEAKGSTTVDGFEVAADMVAFKKTKKTLQEIKYMPSVIEPSFGIGRILHALLEHSFYVRGDSEQRRVMKFKPNMAPVKCGVYNLQGGETSPFAPVVRQIAEGLTAAGLSSKSDLSGVAIGRKYARADEVGTPFGVTVDFQTLDASAPERDTVTLRERDSTAQVRVPIADLAPLLLGIVAELTGWADALAKYPLVSAGDADTGAGDAAPAAKPAAPKPAAKPPRRQGGQAGAGAQAVAKPAAKPAKPAPPADDDDDMDDMFGDDDGREAEGDGREPPQAQGRVEAPREEGGRAEVDGRDRGQAVEADQDLNALWKKIVTEMTFEGLKWGGVPARRRRVRHQAEIVMSCVINMDVSMDDVTEAIQGLEDEVQSVDIISMNVL